MIALVAAVEPCAGPEALSTTVTRMPLRDRAKAIEAPITPLPTTTASAASVLPLMCTPSLVLSAAALPLRCRRCDPVAAASTLQLGWDSYERPRHRLPHT
ncbi:hypothetical protein GCM10009823_08840 [Brevibacterium salitolerans]|uniref:Secreted protein n=1 Tax=Brevibacterium salitolerans TaxID=1403566 RepID=A0ABN2WIP2_9MICO